MNNLQILEKFIKENLDNYDLSIESNKSVAGTAAIFRASIDNVTGGNFKTSGWEYSLEDALEELVKELK